MVRTTVIEMAGPITVAVGTVLPWAIRKSFAGRDLLTRSGLEVATPEAIAMLVAVGLALVLAIRGRPAALAVGGAAVLGAVAVAVQHMLASNEGFVGSQFGVYVTGVGAVAMIVTGGATLVARGARR